MPPVIISKEMKNEIFGWRVGPCWGGGGKPRATKNKNFNKAPRTDVRRRAEWHHESHIRSRRSEVSSRERCRVPPHAHVSATVRGVGLRGRHVGGRAVAAGRPRVGGQQAESHRSVPVLVVRTPHDNSLPESPAGHRGCMSADHVRPLRGSTPRAARGTRVRAPGRGRLAGVTQREGRQLGTSSPLSLCVSHPGRLHTCAWSTTATWTCPST